jgi:hypothetical protein
MREGFLGLFELGHQSDLGILETGEDMRRELYLEEAEQTGYGGIEQSIGFQQFCILQSFKM